MGRFLSRVLALEKKEKRYSTFSKKTLKKILKIFSGKKEIKGTLGVIQSGLRDWCFSKKDACIPLKVLDIKKSIKRSCQKIRRNIQKICSEKDSFYGLSNISEMKLLLEFSHVLSLVDQAGHGRRRNPRGVFQGRVGAGPARDQPVLRRCFGDGRPPRHL